MRKFRITALLLCLMMVLSAIGCTGDTTASSSNAASKKASSSSAEAGSVIASSEEALPPYAHRVVKLIDCPDKWRITGRTAKIMDSTGNEGMIYDHAAQGFFFTADCEGDLSINLSLKIPSQTLGKYTMDFLVRVDGAENYVTVEGYPSESPAVLPVATGLSKGKHSVEIYRCNEPLKGLGVLTSVDLNGTLQTYEAPKKALKMIFIGDSVTSGSGLFALNGQENAATRNPSDATHSYAFIAGSLLNADFYVASRSGSYAAKDTTPNSIYYTYDYISRYRSEALYDNTKDNVDIFVISLGTNDSNKKNGSYIFTEQQVHDNIQALITRVRADHPGAKIVWTYGQLTLDRAATVRGAVEEMMASDKKLYYYQYSIPDNTGGWYHPTAEAQERDGKELADYIRNNVL